MKRSVLILALLCLCATARGALPTFNSFQTNDFRHITATDKLGLANPLSFDIAIFEGTLRVQHMLFLSAVPGAFASFNADSEIIPAPYTPQPYSQALTDVAEGTGSPGLVWLTGTDGAPAWGPSPAGAPTGTLIADPPFTGLVYVSGTNTSAATGSQVRSIIGPFAYMPFTDQGAPQATSIIDFGVFQGASSASVTEPVTITGTTNVSMGTRREHYGLYVNTSGSDHAISIPVGWEVVAGKTFPVAITNGTTLEIEFIAYGLDMVMVDFRIYGDITIDPPPPPPPADSELLDGLRSYWAMDEDNDSGFVNTPRLTSYGATATLSDNTPTTVRSVTGKAGRAARFVDDNTQELSMSTLVLGDANWTFAAWVKANDVVGALHRGIISKWNSTVAENKEFFVAHNTTENKFGFWVSANGAATTTSMVAGPVISTNTWYHVVFWHDATNDEIGLSVNDSSATTAHAGGVYTGTTAFWIGGIANSSNAGTWFNGDVDEVGLWDRVLTAAEITQLYNSGAGLPYPFTP